MTARHHSMPFGAEPTLDGGARFRLWAPGADQVTLCLEGAGPAAELPMEPRPDGWHVLETGRAGVGSLYRYRVDGGLRVPDPASRYQPADVHGPGEVLDPAAFDWRDTGWGGRPWEEAVLYELHVGTFSPTGDFAGVERRLDYLADLGVTAVELMPVADFPGRRGWGYDGVLPFAPDAAYGRPEDLKRLIDAAHARDLMVFLDVVYNHFGPEGNYLHVYAGDFFTERHHTPWGAAINFDGPGSETVRAFFVHNALYWLEEYHLDGLRLDAVHAIADDSRPDILETIAEAVRQGPGRERHVHLVLENDHNAARYLDREARGQPRAYAAQWNDDWHHAAHVLLTGESDGYYRDYLPRPVEHLGRTLTEGFAYQGEPSAYRDGRPRGEPSAHLPPAAFVAFLQNHDQVGNRALGERLDHLAPEAAMVAATGLLLLAPSPPLLFMGEEQAAPQPFLYFCDFQGDLARAVTEGRRREFARFERFADERAREAIPDPNDPETFARSRLTLDTPSEAGRARLALHRRLLALRRTVLVPRLAGQAEGRAHYRVLSDTALAAEWTLGDGSRLGLLANLGPAPAAVAPLDRPPGETLWACPEPGWVEASPLRSLPAWGLAWLLQTGR